MARTKQQPQRFGSRKAETIPARRPTSGASESLSDDDTQGSRVKRTRQSASTAQAGGKRGGGGGGNAIATTTPGTAVRFPPLELQEQEQEPTLWELLSPGERAGGAADSGHEESDDGNAKHDDTIEVEEPDNGTGAGAGAGAGADAGAEEPQPKRRRMAPAADGVPTAALSRGRRQGLGVPNVVQKMSAAMSKAQLAAPARSTRAAQRKQRQEEEEAGQQWKLQSIRAGEEEVVKEVEEAGEAEVEMEPEEEEAEQQGQLQSIRAGEEEVVKEVEETGEAEVEVEPEDEEEVPPTNTPKKRQPAPAASQVRSSGRIQGRRPTIDPDTIGVDGGDAPPQAEEEVAQTTQETNDQDSPYVESEGDGHGETPPPRAPPRKSAERSKAAKPADEQQQPGAKRKRGRPRKDPGADGDDASRETAVAQRRVSSSTSRSARRSTAATVTQEPVKVAYVSTKTATAIVQLMSNVGWTGKRTWKMMFRWLYNDPEYGPAPVTAQGKELLLLLSKLADLYVQTPRPELPTYELFIMQGQDQYLKDNKEHTDSLIEQIGQSITGICDEALEPLAAYSSDATRETAHFRALLAEDLLTFVIPQTASLLETAYALGGSMPDEELDLDDFYVPLKAVRLIHASWHVVSRVASWMAKLEGALAHELGYRAERDILGRVDFRNGNGNNNDSDSDGDNRRARRPSGWSGRSGRFGRNGEISGEMADALLYEASAATKREERSRLKPLLNQLQDEICRARIDLERRGRARPLADYIVDDPVDEVWLPIDTAVSQRPQESQHAQQESAAPRSAVALWNRSLIDEGGNDSDDLVLNVAPPSQTQKNASGGGGAGGSSRDLHIVLPQLPHGLVRATPQQDEAIEDSEDQDEPLMTPAVAASSELGFPVASIETTDQAAEQPAEAEVEDIEIDVPEVEAAEAEAPEAPEVAAAATATATAPALALAPVPVVEGAPVGTVALAEAAAAEAVPAEAPPVEAAPTEAAPAETTNERAYTSDELKLILTHLRGLKGEAQLDLVRLATEFGRNIYDVASRVEGIKNVVRAAALREQKPAPHWAKAGYLIGS